MDIKEARNLIGETNIKYSDDQILKMVDTMKTLANIIVDRFLKMTPEERKEMAKRSSH